MAAQPRALLAANPAYILKEMPESDWCCGCGGTFNLQHYKASTAIGQRKRDNIAASDCRVVATGCPACMLQITDMLSQAGTAGPSEAHGGNLRRVFEEVSAVLPQALKGRDLAPCLVFLPVSPFYSSYRLMPLSHQADNHSLGSRSKISA